MNERDNIRFGDTTIEYQVRRSDRRKKTVQVTVDGGGVQVAAPMDTPARGPANPSAAASAVDPQSRI